MHFTILDKFFGKLSPEVPGSVGLGYIVKLDENRSKHKTLGVTIFYLCVIFFKWLLDPMQLATIILGPMS